MHWFDQALLLFQVCVCVLFQLNLQTDSVICIMTEPSRKSMSHIEIKNCGIVQKQYGVSLLIYEQNRPNTLVVQCYDSVWLYNLVATETSKRFS